MVSVIIPTYKGARYLPRAVDSALQQGVPLEVIVVDDNPPESPARAETEQAMARYSGDSRVVYLRHERNKNGSAARNTGLRAAKGDTIAFLDDDDFFTPERLKQCLAALEESGAGLAWSDVLLVKDGIFCGYVHADKNGNLFVPLFTDENLFGTGSNIVVRKAQVDRSGGFDESLPRHQDFEFLLRLFAGGCTAVCVRSCLAVKAMNGVNNQVPYEKLRDIKYQLFREFDAQLQALPAAERQQILAMQHRELLHLAIVNGSSQGVAEQKRALAELGVRQSQKERLKEALLRLDKKHLMKRALWRLRGRSAVQQAAGVLPWVQQHMAQYE